QLARPEPGAGALRPVEAVDAVAAPVMPVEVVADQVPAAAERDQPVRFHVPGGLLAVRRGVAEAEPLGVPAGNRDSGENTRVYAHPGAAAPARRHGHRAQRLDSAAQP